MRSKQAERDWRAHSGLQGARNLGPLPTPSRRPGARLRARNRALLGLPRWAVLLLGVMLLLGLGWLGRQDEQAAQAEAALYCANVHDHTWPDYAGTYATQCRAGKVRPGR